MRFLSLMSFILLFVACSVNPQQTQSKPAFLSDEQNGQRYYFAWGEYLADEYMNNNMIYDVKHLNDIFTSPNGGQYNATTFSNKEFDAQNILSSMQKMVSGMTNQDMFVQYSGGHGSPQGLEVGMKWSTLVDNILKMPAKEIIIFTMSCYSGSIVDVFNEKKSVWQNFGNEGRTLFVMSSSKDDELSGSGDEVDKTEPTGPSGAGGSYFGNRLWLGLRGSADGALDGVKDGFVSLGEIAVYVTEATEQVGGHTPQVLKSQYDPNIILTKVTQAQ